MATTVNNRDLVLQDTTVGRSTRDPVQLVQSPIPWTNLFPSPGAPASSENVVATSSSILDPFGTFAKSYAPTSSSAPHVLTEQNINTSATYVSGNKVQQTIYVKAIQNPSTKHVIAILEARSGSSFFLRYRIDSISGAVSLVTAGAGWSAYTGTAYALNNGWWKLVVTGTFTGVGYNIWSSWEIQNGAATSGNYVGDNVAGVYLYGPQAYYGTTVPDEAINDVWIDSVSNVTKLWNGHSFITSTGLDGITVALSSDAATVPTNSSGTSPVFTNTGTTIYVYEGSTPLVYDGAGNASSSWTVSTSVSGVTSGTISVSGNNALVAPITAMSADTGTITFTITGKRQNGTAFTITKVKGFNKSRAGVTPANGSPGTRSKTLYMYYWSSTDPKGAGTTGSTWTVPLNGTTTYEWGTDSNTLYSGTNWSTIPTTNTIAGNKLYLASLNIVDTTGAQTNTVVGWASAAPILSTAGANGNNGTDGTKSTTIYIYQWASSSTLAPDTPTATFRYTWSNNTFALLTGSLAGSPGTWTITPGTPTAGWTLWQGSVQLLGVAQGNATTDSNFTTLTAVPISFAGNNGTGTQGISTVIAYARIATGGSNPTSAQITKAGATATKPISTDTAWGTTFSVNWADADPLPSSSDSLYQIDGLFNPATSQTVWNTPYITSLKVASLSAVTVNTGALTITGDLTMAPTAGAIEAGKTSYGDTTNGFFLGYDGAAPAGYKFSLGEPTAAAGSKKGLTWDGTTLTTNSLVVKDANDNVLLTSGTGTENFIPVGINAISNGDFRDGLAGVVQGNNTDGAVVSTLGLRSTTGVGNNYTLTDEGLGQYYRQYATSAATAMVAGTRYMLLSAGNTNFTGLGAANNNAYTFFNATRPASVNLVQNPTYNAATWTQPITASTTTTLTTSGISDPFGGTAALRLTTTTGSTAPVLRVGFTSFTPAGTVSVGTDTYTISFYVKWVSGTFTTLSADLTDLTPSINYQTNLTTAGIGVWTRVTASAVATGVARNFIDLYSNNSNTVTLDFYGVQVEKATSAGPLQLAASTGIVEAVPTVGSTFELDISSGGSGVPVTAGEKVESYCYLNTHRCTAKVVLQFYDYQGTELTGNENTLSNLVSTASEITSIGNMFQSGIITTAPAGAASCGMVIRGITTTNTAEAYIFFARAFLGRAKSSQLGYSPWNSGSGIKQLTLSNISTYVEPLSVASTYIANAAITNAKIGGTISSDDFVTGSTGWAIAKSGACEFGNGAIFRGSLQAATGTFAGSLAAGVLTSSAFDTVVNTFGTYTGADVDFAAPLKVSGSRNWALMSVKVTFWGGGGGGGGSGMAHSYQNFNYGAGAYRGNYYWPGGGGEAGAKGTVNDYSGIASSQTIRIRVGAPGGGAASNTSYTKTQTGYNIVIGPIYSYARSHVYSRSGSAPGNTPEYQGAANWAGNAGGAGGESYYYITIGGTKYSAPGGAGGKGGGPSTQIGTYQVINNQGEAVDVATYATPGGSGGTGADGSLGVHQRTFSATTYGGTGGSSEVGGGGAGAYVSNLGALVNGTSNGFTLAGGGGLAAGGGGGATASQDSQNYTVGMEQYGWTSGGNGGAGYLRFEFYDPNSVVLNSRYSTLISYLVNVQNMTGINTYQGGAAV